MTEIRSVNLPRTVLPNPAPNDTISIYRPIFEAVPMGPSDLREKVKYRRAPNMPKTMIMLFIVEVISDVISGVPIVASS